RAGCIFDSRADKKARHDTKDRSWPGLLDHQTHRQQQIHKEVAVGHAVAKHLATDVLCGLERVKGIEPSYEAWEAAVLPLNYTRLRGRILRRVPQAMMLTPPSTYSVSPD